MLKKLLKRKLKLLAITVNLEIIFASKKYHPQSEIVLQVSDLLEGCNYYSTELQNAAFVFPANITKALTGIAKR